MKGPVATLRLTTSLALAHLRTQPGRQLAGVLAIAIGVALGLAIHLINYSAVREFSQAVATLRGDADLSIQGKLPETLYPAIAADSAVAAVNPVIEIRVNLAKQGLPLLLVGVDALRAARMTPALVGAPITDGKGPAQSWFGDDAVFLSPAALATLRLKAGDTLDIPLGLDTVHLRVAGSLPLTPAGQQLAVIDIATAQWRFGRLGELDRLDIRLVPGADSDAFRQRWQAKLPAGTWLDTPQTVDARSSAMSRAYRVNLSVLGLVALFTGAFLVFSTQVMNVVRQRSQFALLRVLGLSQRGLALLVVTEAGLVGTLGAALGVAGGVAMAELALSLMGGDLGGGYFNGVAPRLAVSPLALLGFFALGLLTAVLGSLAPALEAARARPASALKAGDEETALARIRSPWVALGFMLLALLLLQVPAIGELPLAAYAAIACLLVGAIALMPWLAARVLRLTPQRLLARPVLGLALLQLREAPGYAGIGLAGVVVSFSLMVSMAIMVASFRESVTVWLDELLPASLYLRTGQGGETAFLTAEQAAILARTPGIARAEFQRMQALNLNAERPNVILIARTLDMQAKDVHLPLVGPRVAIPAGSVAVWISEAMRDLYGVQPGGSLMLPLAGRRVPVVVSGVWRDYARQQGSIVMALADYQRLTGDTRVSDMALWLAEGTDVAALQSRMRAAVPQGERLSFAEPGDIRRISLSIFDRSFAVTYLLEYVAMLVGLMGIGVSVSAEALARLREFGMLRHIGYQKRDIDLLLACEGALLTGLGVLAGFGIGWLISRILIDVVNPQSFHWTMDTSIPWRMLITVAASLIALAVVTAVLAGRKTLAMSAVAAVKADW